MSRDVFQRCIIFIYMQRYNFCVDEYFFEVKLKMKKPQIYKICVFGESGVGKSTLLNKYFKEANNESLGVPPKLTLGVTFYQGTLKVDDVDLILHVWELTGAEKFKDLKIKRTKREGNL